MADLDIPGSPLAPVCEDERLAPTLCLRPTRDHRGKLVSVAMAQLVDARAMVTQLVTPASSGEPKSTPGMPVIAVTSALLFRLVPGDRLKLRDAHGRGRTLRVVAVNEWGAVVRAKRTTHLADGTGLRFGRVVGHVEGLPHPSAPQGRGGPAPA